jgi:hypothetical protein
MRKGRHKASATDLREEFVELVLPRLLLALQLQQTFGTRLLVFIVLRHLTFPSLLEVAIDQIGEVRLQLDLLRDAFVLILQAHNYLPFPRLADLSEFGALRGAQLTRDFIAEVHLLTQGQVIRARQQFDRLVVLPELRTRTAHEERRLKARMRRREWEKEPARFKANGKAFVRKIATISSKNLLMFNEARIISI